MKYTRNNMSDICAKHLKAKNLGLVAAVQQTGILMFINNIPEDDEVKLVRQALTNLTKSGYFSFEPE